MARGLMQSSNPVLSSRMFLEARGNSAPMSVTGTVNKTLFLLFLLVVMGSYTWGLFFKTGNMALVNQWMIGGLVGGIIFGLMSMFKPAWIRFSAPMYALCQGAAMGGISAVFQAQYPGIVFQAVGLTIFTLLGMLFAFRTGLIQVTDSFRSGIISATLGIGLFYLLSIVLGFFGIEIPLIHGSGLFGIGFSVFVVSIAALNLVLDFDFIYKASRQGAPKEMEWVGAFGLLVTLIWLYLEFLRLLSKLRNR